ncbi:unnamed protein product [Bursaphelenchus xylophilus]|uniref:(pine wood nematode) hypothetical protein n=1 Tax=Bursaphelenchus xylophilus TaxID=6326 RepID=A0A7I8X4T2_BURXY|nr:unnamed protein product [Bursaphelenchus xylophilus]CAG9128749.1 unnamed protein product [Bursaphelenchus xylophilus]
MNEPEAMQDVPGPSTRPDPPSKDGMFVRDLYQPFDIYMDIEDYEVLKDFFVLDVREDDVDDLLGENADVPQAQTSAMNGTSSSPNPFTATEPADENTRPSEEDIFATPPVLNLMAELKVPITITAREVYSVCQKRKNRIPNSQVFDERCGPPKVPSPPKDPKINLHPQVPLIYVENDRDAKSIELQNFCYKSTIAVVRGLTSALKVDLSQFSTKTLILTDRNHEVEVRTQLKMPGDANLDNLGRPTWSCYSAKSFSSVGRYGQYQAESFRHSLKEETEKLRNVKQTPPTQRAVNGEPAPKRRKAAVAAIQAEAEAQTNLIPTKTIKFGTNVDLSDEIKFSRQLTELAKMPAFCRLHSASNLLSYLDFKVLGMNTVQLYMKVPGCRTPGHLENNSFASVNINIGPGECEWFGVAWEYYPMIDKMCRERGLDFLRGAWWPSYDELIEAGIPVYRFTQKAGDLVWVGGGCVHWVQATGWCNNIAWNVGPSTAFQMEMAIRAYEWNRLNSYRSLVPMQHLCWQIARALRFTDQKLYNLVKGVLIRSFAYSKMVMDFAEEHGNMTVKFQSRIKNEGAHYCNLCELEVFNILFVKEFNSKFRVFCVSCAKRGNIKEYILLQQYTFDELSSVFDQFQYVSGKAGLIC